MGIETGVLVMGAIAAGATVGKTIFQMNAAEQKQQALDTQAKQQQIQYQQKTLSNLDVLEKTLEAQEAAMTVTGTAFSSPSFNAIQRATFNINSKKQRNTDIENSLIEENINIEKENVRNSLYAQMFGNVASAASSAYSISQKMPSKLPQLEA